MLSCPLSHHRFPTHIILLPTLSFLPYRITHVMAPKFGLPTSNSKSKYLHHTPARILISFSEPKHPATWWYESRSPSYYPSAPLPTVLVQKDGHFQDLKIPTSLILGSLITISIIAISIKLTRRLLVRDRNFSTEELRAGIYIFMNI